MCMYLLFTSCGVCVLFYSQVNKCLFSLPIRLSIFFPKNYSQTFLY